MKVSSIYIVKNSSFLAYKVSIKHTHCTCLSLFVSETFASAKADACVKLKSWNHPTCQDFWVSQIEVLPSSSFRGTPFPNLAILLGFTYISQVTLVLVRNRVSCLRPIWGFLQLFGRPLMLQIWFGNFACFQFLCLWLEGSGKLNMKGCIKGNHNKASHKCPNWFNGHAVYAPGGKVNITLDP